MKPISNYIIDDPLGKLIEQLEKESEREAAWEDGKNNSENKTYM